MCLYSLSYVYLYHIFCTRPAGLLVCLFVYQNVQGANGKHITIKKDTWNLEARGFHTSARGCTFCSEIAQVLPSTAAPIKIKSHPTKQQYGRVRVEGF